MGVRFMFGTLPFAADNTYTENKYLLTVLKAEFMSKSSRTSTVSSTTVPNITTKITIIR